MNKLRSLTFAVLLGVAFFVTPVYAHDCVDGLDNDGDNLIDDADDLCDGSWQTLAPMPTVRGGPRAALLNDQIYVLGGSSIDSPANYLSTVEVYDPVNNLWSNTTPLNQGRYAGHVAHSINGKLYVVGGLIKPNNQPIALNSVEVYDPDTLTWSFKTPMPTARYGLSSAVVGSKIYVIGGNGINAQNIPTPALSLMESYDVSTDSWETHTPPPVTVHNAGAATLAGKIYLVGGQNLSELSSAQVQVYDPVTDTWGTVSPLPTTIISPGVEILNNSMYVYGGHIRTSSGVSLSKRVFEYSVEDDKWFERDEMPIPRTQFASVSYDNKAYAIGGSGGGFFNLTEAFTPSFTEGVPIEPETKGYEDLVAELEMKVDSDVSDKSLLQSYFAHIKNLLPFYEKLNLKAARNQIGALINKFNHDTSKDDLSSDLSDELIDISEQIDAVLAEADAPKPEVPLMTQVASPHPPESENWADDVYAGGVDTACPTIAACGCAVSSMAMLAHSYGVKTGIDGTDINPGNMNAWLTANQGYTADGTVWWNKVIEYFGTLVGGQVKTNFALSAHNTTSQSKLDDFLSEGKPAIAYNNLFGHYFVLTEKNNVGSYNVRDPHWYETATTDDPEEAGSNIKDYNNQIDKTNLFTFSKTPHVLAKAIEIYLASPAELLLTDSQGRRVGFDPVTNSVLTEVPGSSYDQHSGVFTGQSEASAHLRKSLYLTLPEDEVYTLEVIGTDTGNYTLSVLTVSDKGKTAIDSVVGTTIDGQVDEYLVLRDGGDEELVALLNHALALVPDLPDSIQEKVENKLRIILDKVEKDNLVAADSLVAGLLTQLSKQGITDTEIVEFLLALGNSL